MSEKINKPNHPWNKRTYKQEDLFPDSKTDEDRFKKKKWGLRCKKCKDEIYSEYRHGFKWCKCGKIAIDGGNDYNKITG